MHTGSDQGVAWVVADRKDLTEIYEVGPTGKYSVCERRKGKDSGGSTQVLDQDDKVNDATICWNIGRGWVLALKLILTMDMLS